MTTGTADTSRVPEGLEFLHLVWAQEDKCELTTDDAIAEFGEKAPNCLELLGTVLSLLDRMSTCWWHCFGGDDRDHRLEYLVGRAYSRARAALRLLRLGFYDEALSLTRMVGESANLLFLFLVDERRWHSWRSRGSVPVSRVVRGAIKEALKRGDPPLPLEDTTWTQLSDRTHAGHKPKPQSYNINDRPTAGAYFQPEGTLIALNELSEATGYVARIGASVARRAGRLDPEHWRTVVDASEQLLESVGGVRLGNIRELWDSTIERNN